MKQLARVFASVACLICVTFISITAQAEDGGGPPYLALDAGIFYSPADTSQFEPVQGASIQLRGGYQLVSNWMYLSAELVGSYQNYFQDRYESRDSTFGVGREAPDSAYSGMVGFRAGTDTLNSVKMFAHLGMGQFQEDDGPQTDWMWDIGLALDIGMVPVVTPGIHVSYTRPGSFGPRIEGGIHVTYEF